MRLCDEPRAGTAPPEFPADEWAVRTDLAALYRLVAHFRMTDMIDTHISARLPGHPGEAPTFLINRYGLLFIRCICIVFLLGLNQSLVRTGP
jgi:hypothetical protein